MYIFIQPNRKLPNNVETASFDVEIYPFAAAAVSAVETIVPIQNVHSKCQHKIETHFHRHLWCRRLLNYWYYTVSLSFSHVLSLSAYLWSQQQNFRSFFFVAMSWISRWVCVCVSTKVTSMSTGIKLKANLAISSFQLVWAVAVSASWRKGTMWMLTKC